MFLIYYYNVLKEIKYPDCDYELANKLKDDCVYNDDNFINNMNEIFEEL